MPSTAKPRREFMTTVPINHNKLPKPIVPVYEEPPQTDLERANALINYAWSVPRFHRSPRVLLMLDKLFKLTMQSDDVAACKVWFERVIGKERVASTNVLQVNNTYQNMTDDELITTIQNLDLPNMIKRPDAVITASPSDKVDGAA